MNLTCYLLLQCETWCSKDRLHRAKTIDLCQNPLTVRTSGSFIYTTTISLNIAFIRLPQKEPKLARARQIPEWDEYDTEIAQLTRRLAEEGKIHSRMATADANVLADAGAATAGSIKLPADIEPEHDTLGVAKGDAAASEEPGHDEL